MQNDRSDHLSSPFTLQDAPSLGENNVFVAATLAAVVVAGSFMIYRHATTASSKEHPPKEPLLEATSGLESQQDVKRTGVGAAPLDAGADIATASTSIASAKACRQGEGDAGANTASVKNPRSKERRRRGKDPLREVLKSGKKLKSFAIPSMPSSSTSMFTSPDLPSAPFNPDLSSTRKEQRSPDSAGSSTSFQSPQPNSSSPLPSVQPQTMLTSLRPSFSRRNSDKRRQREESVVIISSSTRSEYELPGHTRTMLDVSHISRSSHEGYNGDEEFEREDEVLSRGRYNQHTHQQNSSQTSLTQSSLSHSFSRPPSSLADISEIGAEDDGWITKGPKDRSRSRVQFSNEMFGAEHLNMENKWEENQLWQGEDQEMPTSGPRSTSELTSQDSMGRPDDKSTNVEKASLCPPATPPRPQSNAHDAPHQGVSFPNPMLLSPNVIRSPEKNKNKVRKPQTQQKNENKRSWEWVAHFDNELSPKSVVSSINDDENDKTPINEGERKENENEGWEKPPMLLPKGKSGASYESFSSALVEGGEKVLIGQCRTVAVSVNMLGTSTSGSGLAGGNENCGSSLGTDDSRDQKEFTFPTLNSTSPTAVGSKFTCFWSFSSYVQTAICDFKGTRPALTDSSANFPSPSKKNRRTGKSSQKSGTPPPYATPTSPSSHQTRESSGVNTGSGNTMALSAQTQLASLRGALEAARLREERSMKEIEALKLEKTKKEAEVGFCYVFLLISIIVIIFKFSCNLKFGI